MADLVPSLTDVSARHFSAHWHRGFQALQSPVARYGLAVVSVAVAVGLSLLLRYYQFGEVALPIVTFAVAVTTWYGGNGPSVVSIVLSTLCFDYFFVAPYNSFEIAGSELPYLFIFVIWGLTISGFCAVRRRVEEHLRQAQEDLAKRVEALRRSEMYLTEAQRLSHTGSWAYDPAACRFLYWSEECYRLWEFDPVQGLPDPEAAFGRIHPDDRHRVYEQTMEARREKRDYTIEFRIVLPDGTVKYVECNGHHVFSARGELVEGIGTDCDVTERKRARDGQERLRQLESDLAHISRLSVMGELTASLAHEITQPIASARNNAHSALNFLNRQPPELDEVGEALVSVVGDAARAAEIIDRIRDHIRKAPPRKVRFDLNHAIDEVIALGRTAITKNRVSVQTRFAEGLFPVQGDRVQLQQVILNLVLNAVEAMSAVEGGARELMVSTEQSQENGALVRVRDSGPGINPDNVERVFETFYTTKPSGMGMGLAICRTIIEAHGGRLWADANEPRGAVFQFTLPGAEDEVMTSRDPA